MAKRIVLSLLVIGGLMVLVPVPAHACLNCFYYYHTSQAACVGAVRGGDICVIGQYGPGSCSTYYVCECGGQSCSCPPSGCPAKLDNPLAGKPEVKSCSLKAMRGGPLKLVGQSPKAKLADFLRRIDSGQFSDPHTRVYMSSGSSLTLDLMNTVPVDHWNKWQFGIEKDQDDKMVKTYHLETKAGKSATIIIK
jgi:hypothetical protein